MRQPLVVHGTQIHNSKKMVICPFHYDPLPAKNTDAILFSPRIHVGNSHFAARKMPTMQNKLQRLSYTFTDTYFQNMGGKNIYQKIDIHAE